MRYKTTIIIKDDFVYMTKYGNKSKVLDINNRLRSSPYKFICINDERDTYPYAIPNIMFNFYSFFFKLPSQFELY